MCINIWQKFHLLHLFSIGLMHEASVLKAFEWKLQKRAEREKGCRQDWVVGRAAGKPEDSSRGGPGLWRRGVGVHPPDGGMGVHAQHGTLTPNPAAQAPRLPASLPSFSSLVFFSSHPREQMGVRGEGGQHWKPERNVLQGLFSHLSPGQERVGFPGAPQPMDLTLLGLPEQDFHQLPPRASNPWSSSRWPQPPWLPCLQSQLGIFLLFQGSRHTGSHVLGSSPYTSLFPAAADAGQNAQALTNPSMLMVSGSLSSPRHQLRSQPGNWGEGGGSRLQMEF